MYKINYIPLSDYGAVATTRPMTTEATALTGAFSLPKRKGDTELDWGTSVEPLVDEQDIAFEGRALTLHMRLDGSTTERLDALKEACLSAWIVTAPYASFFVIQKDEITVKEYRAAGVSLLTVPFYEQSFRWVASDAAPSGGEGYLIDGYNLRDDFSIVVRMQGDRNAGARIDVDTTLFYEGRQHRKPVDVSLHCSMLGSGMADIYPKMTAFHALCAKAGLRTLTLPDGRELQGYVRDGFTAKAVCRRWVNFELKFRAL